MTEKTSKLADQHYKRVSNFAKEMLVWPQEVNVHKIKNPSFISEVKPSRNNEPTFLGGPSSSSDHFRGSGGDPAALKSNLQPPMKFGSYQTGAERLAYSILKQQALDPSPSKRTVVGSDIAVLNLRPEDHTRMLGRPGHLRVKAQSSIQEQLDRMSMERPRVLDPDLSL